MNSFDIFIAFPLYTNQQSDRPKHMKMGGGAP